MLVLPVDALPIIKNLNKYSIDKNETNESIMIRWIIYRKFLTVETLLYYLFPKKKKNKEITSNNNRHVIILFIPESKKNNTTDASKKLFRLELNEIIDKAIW